MWAGCKYWRDQADGFHGLCNHPEALPGTTCILNTEVTCLLREEPEEELVPVHTCLVCGNTTTCEDYEAHGCILCGADSEA